MAYDDRLADRIRVILGDEAGVDERRMFGGLSFLLNGNMCCGVLGDRLVVRLGEVAARKALEWEHASPMDFTGRSSRNMVYVSAAGLADDAELQGWVDQAVRFAATLPPKA